MNRKILFLAILLFSLHYSEAQDTLRLQPYIGNLKKLDIKIQSKSYSFLFDTGGGETFISTEIVEAIRKDSYGKVTGFRMSGEKLFSQKCDSVTILAGNTELFHLTIGVWDIMNILPKELPKIDGVLSLKSFENKILTIDLSKNILVVETVRSFKRKVKECKKVPSVFSSGQNGLELDILLSIRKNNRSYLFLFDTGNLDEIILSTPIANEWDLEKKEVIVNKRYKTSINFMDSIFNIDVITKDIIYDGVFNYAFIKNNVYILNLSKKEVWTKFQQ